MPQDAILTWPDYADEPQGLNPYPRFKGRPYLEYLRHQFEHLQGVPAPEMPVGRQPVAYPQVNAGRWIWQCAGCRLAVPLEHGSPVICPGCGGGGWHEVAWPVERDAIEAELLRQPGRRLLSRVRHWRPDWTLEDLKDRTAKANELIAQGIVSPASLSIALTRTWTAGEIPTAMNFNNHVSTPIDDLSGDNGTIELRDSLEVLDGSAGDRFLGFPAGSQAQRPTTRPVGATRLNTSISQVEAWSGTEWITSRGRRHYTPRNAVSQGRLPGFLVPNECTWDGMQLVLIWGSNSNSGIYTLDRNLSGTYTASDASDNGNFGATNRSAASWDGLQLVLSGAVASTNRLYTLPRNIDGSYTPANYVSQGDLPYGAGTPTIGTVWDGTQLVIVSTSELWTLARNANGTYTPANAVSRGTFPAALSASGITWDDTQLVISSSHLWTLARNSSGHYTPANAIDRGDFPPGMNSASGVAWDNLQLVFLQSMTGASALRTLPAAT